MANLILNKIRKKMKEDSLTEGKLGSTIKYKRKERNKTLQSLSNIVGISVSYISKVENNVINPNLETIKGVLETLEINEKIIESSLIMDDWYIKTVCHILGLKNNKEELNKYINERNDFQSRLMKFALVVSEKGFSVATEELSLLMYSLNQMSNLEFIIYLLSLVRYHLNDDDYLNAALILKEIKSRYLEDTYIAHWYYQLRFEIALMQEDYGVFNNAKDNYLKYLFLHNKLSKMKEVRNDYISALSYFMAPNEFENIADRDYQRSKRIAMVLHKDFDNFNNEKEIVDLALLIYYDEIDKKEEVLKLISKVDFNDSIFEQALKAYFQVKYYDKNNYFYFLKEQIFSTTAITQHYYGMRFFANEIKKTLLKQFKYKEITLINEEIVKRKIIL